MIKLIIFDVDGTLVQSHRLVFLPHVKDFFYLVLSGGCSDRPKLAIATNQGGVGMRYWSEKQRFWLRGGYPSQADVETRLHHLLVTLDAGTQIPVYVSFRYKDKKEQWSPIPPGEENNPRWRQDWRKPGPGMLLQAMADAGVPPEETIYIGDRAEDQAAAKAAGCAFQWAKDFFNSDWGDCERLSERLRNIQLMEGH